VDPKRDVLLSEGPLDHLDHAPSRQFYGGKLGIDATAKGPAEGTREWPPEIEMSAEVKALVDARWSEYGITATSGGEGVQNGPRRRLTRVLRR
jgi:4-hydroxy-3-polyprenylbenzoate decarboxylase